MQVTIDGVRFGEIEACGFEIAEVKSGTDVAHHHLIAGKSYTFSAEVRANAEHALFEPLQAFCRSTALDMVERYYLNAFGLDVSPVLNVYPGRSVVTRATSFDLVTEARVVGMTEVPMLDGATVELELEETAR